MSATYTVSLYDPFGTPLADISNFTKLSYTRVVNDWSTLTLTLPPGFDTSLIRIPDGRIVVWRNGTLEAETIWLIRVMRPMRDEQGNVTIEVEADTPLSILREPGRFMNHYSGGATPVFSSVGASLALINTASSALWKEITTLPQRDVRAYIGLGPILADSATITRATSDREALAVLRDIANDAAQQGVYIAFDIVASAPDALEFRTFLNQRGIDHRFPNGQPPVVFSGDMGNIGACSLELNYRDEVTVAFAYGRGSGPARPANFATDDTRSAVSPFGYRELFVESNFGYDVGTTTTTLQGVARAAVRAGRPYAVLSGKILDTPQARYGVHWNWGDYVTISEFGYTLDCRIDAISVTVDDADGGQFETIDASFRAETPL